MKYIYYQAVEADNRLTETAADIHVRKSSALSLFSKQAGCPALLKKAPLTRIKQTESKKIFQKGLCKYCILHRNEHSDSLAFSTI